MEVPQGPAKTTVRAGVQTGGGPVGAFKRGIRLGKVFKMSPGGDNREGRRLR